MVFNGEVYNSLAIKQELGIARWRGHSDTEVMLEAIERWGVEAAVRRFIGMFAIAVWDRHDRRLWLIRDRIGIKPLCYGRVAGQFVFGSELIALRQFPGFDGRIDPRALALFVRHSYIPAPFAIYEGLHKLPPGCILTLDETSAEPRIEPVLVGDRGRPGGPGVASDARLRQVMRRPRPSSMRCSPMRSGSAWSRTCRSAPFCRAALIRPRWLR